MKDLSLDDLVCLYNCVDYELQRFALSSTPETLRKYFNQLSHLLSVIHSDIIDKNKSNIKIRGIPECSEK